MANNNHTTHTHTHVVASYSIIAREVFALQNSHTKPNENKIIKCLGKYVYNNRRSRKKIDHRSMTWILKCFLRRDHRGDERNVSGEIILTWLTQNFFKHSLY